MYTNIFKKASDIVDSCEEGYFSAIDDKGYPNVATRSNIKSNGVLEVYLSTGTSGNMAKSIMSNPKSSICFHKAADNVTLIGESKIITDKQIKKELWIDWFINHFPGGVDDPEYCVIKFTTNRVSLWIDREVAKFDMSEITKITSRCGLMCNNCEWKEPYQCKGCIASAGHPFHGECPIALCAQEKGLIHCGECNQMPCDKLYDYSCGDSEHCDNPKGARLDVLKMWAQL